MTKLMNNWKAPKSATVPDFIIIGAMKSATSSLHHMLNQHPSVFIPDNEIGFFDIDNIYQHPDFFFFVNNNWYHQDMNKNPDLLWSWYSNHFSSAKTDQLIGEDSTSYLASEIAAKRVAIQEKKPKIIIMLRQPTMRAYSQYWHMLRTGRATYSFEDTIKYYPESILERSNYLKQIESWLNFFPRENLKIILFEDFLSNKENYLREVCNFLSLDYSKLPKNVVKIKKNTARLALFPKINALKNRMFREFGNNRYLDILPVSPSYKNNYSAFLTKLISGFHLLLNPLIRKEKPKINPYTKAFLDNYFEKKLEGINELVGRDITSKWF